MISRKNVLSYLATTFIFLCIVNLISVRALWYYIYWWFDMPMHFIGGMAVLFLSAYVFYDRVISINGLNIKFLLLCALVLGIGWELFEYIFNNMYAGLAFDIEDTLLDIVFDMAGGVLAIFLLKNSSKSAKVV